MEFIRHKWRVFLLLLLGMAVILGICLLLWSQTEKKSYTGGLLVQENAKNSACGFLQSEIKWESSGGKVKLL